MTSPAANPKDVETLDAIIDASYALISGKAREPRDWPRFIALFVPGGRLMPITSGADSHLRMLTPDDFIERVTPIFASEDFYERESHRKTELVGRFAHVLSEYDSLRDLAAEPFGHGTNSMQLYNDGQRWWIVSIMWNTPRSA